MQVISGAPGKLPGSLYSEIGHYRRRIFVEQLGWELCIQDGEERDQFDRPDTVYVVAQEDDGRISGCARLLPTNRPYLLGEVFPQLMNGLPPPCSPDIWELSRFAARDLSAQGCEQEQFSSPVRVELLRESVRYAAARGAKRLISVSPLGVERLIRRAGFNARRAGPPMIVDGHPICACWIEFPQDFSVLQRNASTSMFTGRPDSF